MLYKLSYMYCYMNFLYIVITTNIISCFSFFMVMVLRYCVSCPLIRPKLISVWGVRRWERDTMLVELPLPHALSREVFIDENSNI